MRHTLALAALALLPAAAAAQGFDLDFRPQFRLRLPDGNAGPQQGPPYFYTQPQQYAAPQYARPYVQEGTPFAAPSGGCTGGGGLQYLGSFDVDQRGQYLGGTGLGPQLFGLMFAQQQGYGAPSPVPATTYGAPAGYSYNGNGNGFRAYQNPYNGGYTNGGYGGGYAAPPAAYGAPAGYGGGGGYVYCPPGVR